MPKLIDDQKMDSILLLREKGLSYQQICDILSTSDATVGRVIKADEAARQHDMAELRTICKDREHLLAWACKRYGIKEQEPKPAPEPKPDNTAKAFTALLDAINNNTEETVSVVLHFIDSIGQYLSPEIKELKDSINALDKRLSAMQLTQQGFRADVQQQVAKVIEAVNVNGDIITKDQEKSIELLSGIKSNTKRGPAV